MKVLPVLAFADIILFYWRLAISPRMCIIISLIKSAGKRDPNIWMHPTLA
jgi:hypothetical protein